MTMNIGLMKKFESAFLWWFEDTIKRSLNVKMNGKWDIAVYTIFDCDQKHNDDIVAIVPNDKHSKSRMDHADGAVIQMNFSVHGEDWRDVDPQWADNREYRVKPSWKWQDEISEDKPVICKCISEHAGTTIEPIIEWLDDGCHSYVSQNGKAYNIDRPITAEDLHPFQREGWIEIDGLDDLWRKFVNKQSKTDVVVQPEDFFDDLKERVTKC